MIGWLVGVIISLSYYYTVLVFTHPIIAFSYFLFLISYFLFITSSRFVIITTRPISIAMFTPEQQLSSIISNITHSHFPDRLLLTLYTPTDSANDCVMRRTENSRQLHCVKKSVYPLNRLRNIAMRRVRTTHLFLLDMDCMMSRKYCCDYENNERPSIE